MDNPVRLGFIGAGQHARSMLYPSLHFVPQVQLMAIATQTETSAARAKSDFRVRCHIGYENRVCPTYSTQYFRGLKVDDGQSIPNT